MPDPRGADPDRDRAGVPGVEEMSETKPFIYYGPGGSASCDSLQEAESYLRMNNFRGAIYIRNDIAQNRAQVWKKVAKRWKWTWQLEVISNGLHIRGREEPTHD